MDVGLWDFPSSVLFDRFQNWTMCNHHSSFWLIFQEVVNIEKMVVLFFFFFFYSYLPWTDWISPVFIPAPVVGIIYGNILIANQLFFSNIDIAIIQEKELSHLRLLHDGLWKCDRSFYMSFYEGNLRIKPFPSYRAC